MEHCPAKGGKKLTAVQRMTYQSINSSCDKLVVFDRVRKWGQRVSDLVRSESSKKYGDYPAGSERCPSEHGYRAEDFKTGTGWVYRKKNKGQQKHELKCDEESSFLNPWQDGFSVGSGIHRLFGNTCCTDAIMLFSCFNNTASI